MSCEFRGAYQEICHAHSAWSKGCHSCRRMKVKCDEAKPECQRCTKGGRPCPGYREDHLMRFRSMNSWAATKTSASVETMPWTGSETAPLMLTRPSTDWTQYATARFIQNYTMPASFNSPGYLEFLPQMLKLPSPCLQEALLAVSAANLANISRMRQLQRMSQVHYGRALQFLRTALTYPSTAAADETLMAVVLLQKHEIISGIKKQLVGPHDAAAAAIVRQQRPCSSIRDGLHRTVQANTVIRTVCASFEDGNLDMDNSVLNKSPLGSSLWRLLSKASTSRLKLQRVVSQILNGSCLLGTVFNEALQETVDIYFKLISWPSSTALDWKFSSISTLPQEQDCDGTLHILKRLYIFRNIQHAAIWMVYWCGCIHLVQSLNEGYQLFRKGYTCQSDYSGLVIPEGSLRHKLLSCVSEICSSAPYLLGDINEQGELTVGGEAKGLGAFFLLRGLMTANSVENIFLCQRQLILDYLDRIGSAFGIKLASDARTRWLDEHTVEAELLEKYKLGNPQ